MIFVKYTFVVRMDIMYDVCICVIRVYDACALLLHVCIFLKY